MKRPLRGGFGWSLRRATPDEQVAGTDPVSGGFVRRGCGSRCAEPVVYLASFYVRVPDPTQPGGQGIRRRIRWLCTGHAERFARRHELAPPAALPTRDQQPLLPFAGNKGETP